MNTSAVAIIIAFVMIFVVMRIACSWIKTVAYASAGQTPRSVQKHRNMTEMKKIPQEKECRWIIRISPRPVLTRFFYGLYYFIVSLPLLGAAVGAVNLFVTSIDRYVQTAVMCGIGLAVFLAIFGFLFCEPICYFLRKR